MACRLIDITFIQSYLSINSDLSILILQADLVGIWFSSEWVQSWEGLLLMDDLLTVGASLATAKVILGIKDLKLSSELIGQLKCDVICCLLVAAESLLRRPQKDPKLFAFSFLSGCITARSCEECSERRESTAFNCFWCHKLTRFLAFSFSETVPR